MKVVKEVDNPPHDEWRFYGSDFGGKVDGLLAFEKEKVTGVGIARGKAIGASFFRQFVSENRFDDNTWPNDVNQAGRLPDKLLEANRQILSGFPPGACVAVRSSVVGENEGVGVYSSFFMVTTGDMETDLETLAKLELQIYADYFSYDSRDFLDGKFMNSNEGVGLLIQEVIGDQYEDFWMPAISGVATTINGEFNLRLVLGLGTKAVKTGDAVVLKRNNLRPEVIGKALFSLKEAEAISLTEGGPFPEPLEYEWKVRMVSQVGKLMRLIEDWRNLEKNGVPYYWEFAIDEGHDHPQILQANREELLDERTTIEFGPATGRVMCESDDVANIGTKTGRGIIHLNLNGVDFEDLRHLLLFNQTNRGYLLIVDDTLFSTLSRRGDGLGLSHFSNAAGIIERQHLRDGRNPYHANHVGQGGTHFIGACKRKDILFQGVPAYPWDGTLGESLGPFNERFGRLGGYWDVEYKMTNTKDEGRVEVYGEAAKREYSREKLRHWKEELDTLAEVLESFGEDKETSDSLSLLCFYLNEAVGNSVANYNPYDFVELLSPEYLEELILALDRTVSHLHFTESYVVYLDEPHNGTTKENNNASELYEYLQKLKQKIQVRLIPPSP